MNRVNWHAMEKATKTIKKNHKSLQKAGALLKNFPGPGQMTDWKMLPVKNEDGTDKLDPIGKVIKEKTIVFVNIKDCKSPALRRYVSMLNTCYYLVTAEADKKRILDKKIEIESELNIRKDGLI